MAVLFNHFKRLAPRAIIRTRDIPGYTGTSTRLLTFDVPLIEEVGMATSDSTTRTDLLAGEQQPDVLTDLDTLRGTENIRPVGQAWKTSVEFPNPQRTTDGGKLKYRILWRPIGRVS